MPATATAAPAELGIVHRADMVRALLNTKPGAWPAEPINPNKPFKFQTRRLLKPQPTSPPGTPGILIVKGEYFPRSTFAYYMAQRSRYRPVGRRLWVREPATVYDIINERGVLKSVRLTYGADLRMTDFIAWPDRLRFNPVRGRSVPRGVFREASRILLGVVDVRVEQLESISQEDAKAEGVALTPCTHPDCGGKPCTGYRGEYACLWNEMHGDTYPWGSKPWVEVVTYRRIG